MRKTVRGIVLILFIVSMINCSYAYSDINNEHWAYESINELTNKNILSGYPDGTFRPNSNITRAEFITILIHVIEPNADVSCDTGYWADGSIKLAKEKGIIIENEYSDINFDYDITRREICLMMYRSFKELENVDTEKLSNKKQFLDISKNNKEEERITAILSHIGVLTGYPDGTVKLDGFSSRAETCCFINNFMKSRCILLSVIKDNEFVAYENDIVVVNKSRLPFELKKWQYSEDIPYVTTKIKNIEVFPFSNPSNRYKAIFDRINSSDNPYLQYRKKFGENNFVIAVEFETTNNTNSYEVYAGAEFLRVSFPEEDIFIIDAFDTDEIDRQLVKNADVGKLVNPGEIQNTSAFYIVSTIPKNKVRFDRSITGLYDKEKNQNMPFTSFHSLIVDLDGTVM